MDNRVHRILDANANRAREALRVMEDYARFALNDSTLSGAFKSLRHDLTEAIKILLPDAILHRDTPGDVGTTVKTAQEMQRADLYDIVTAAGKRLGEALPAIEECLKVIAPAIAPKVESLRYQHYDLEMRVARTLRPALRFEQVRLYVLITESICRKPWMEAAREAIHGGADCLQLREKDLSSGELLHRAMKLVRICRRAHVLCIINDRPDIAMMADADGVHVGQEDIPASLVRTLIGREKILGVSTHNLEQAKKAVLDGADYIGVGPIFKSPTKPRDFIAGPEYAREVARHIPIPAVAIAGINEQNLPEVLATGIKAVAISSAVLNSDNPRAAASRLKNKLVQSAPAGQGRPAHEG